MFEADKLPGKLFAILIAVSAFLGLFVLPSVIHDPAKIDADQFPLTKTIFRVETVRSIATNAGKRVCVAFFGNSRSAFQINAGTLGNSRCKAFNLGFPGLGAVNMAEMVGGRFSSEIETIDTVVFVLSLELFVLRNTETQESTLSEQSALLKPANLRELMIESRLMNQIGRGQVAFAKNIDKLRGKPSLSNGWVYDQNLGRWVYSSLSERVLDSLPSKTQEMKELAFSHYALRRLPEGVGKRIAELLQAVSPASQVVLLLPPEHPEFANYRKYYLPDAERIFKAEVKNLSTKFNTEVIDCHLASDCGLTSAHFADAVHLNRVGAEVFSEHINTRMVKYLASDN